MPFRSGFQLGEYPEYADEEAPSKRESLRRLADYVDAALARGRVLHGFACWADEEGRPSGDRRVVTPRELRGDTFWFRLGEVVSFAAG